MTQANDRGSFSGLIDEITEYRDHLKAGADLAQEAIARLLGVAEYHAQVPINQDKGNGDSGEAGQE